MHNMSYTKSTDWEDAMHVFNWFNCGVYTIVLCACAEDVWDSTYGETERITRYS